MKHPTLLTTAMSAALLSSSAFATGLIDFTSPTINFSNGSDWTLGYSFHVNNTIIINGLSVYDQDQDGLDTSHAAGLWTSSGTLLSSTLIPAGTAAPLDGFFRVGAITPITLTAGNDYVVGARTENEGYTWNPNGFSTLPDITFLSDQYVSDPGLTFPSVSGGGVQGWFGGNANIAATPDAGSTLSLMGAAVGILGIARRRKH